MGAVRAACFEAGTLPLWSVVGWEVEKSWIGDGKRLVWKWDMAFRERDRLAFLGRLIPNERCKVVLVKEGSKTRGSCVV